MENTLNGSQPKVVAAITIQMLDNGHIVTNAQCPDPLVAFHMIGQATSLLAAEVQKQKAQQIQVAPAELINRLR